MATSSCVRCGGHDFEMKEISVMGSVYMKMAIQCSSCGGVVGILDVDNEVDLLIAQNLVLTQIARSQGVSTNLRIK